MATKFGVKPKTPKVDRLKHCGEETIMDLIFRFFSDEAGAPALEYAIILAILGVGLMGGMNAIGDALNGVFGKVSTKLASGS
jgi:Flp pilus assembly pilin Flp